MSKRAVCHECGVQEGEMHKYSCDMERCPFCGRQLISCGCCYRELDIDVSPGTSAYKYGLTQSQSVLWQQRLAQKGRVPWIEYPDLCVRCGSLWPESFSVSDEDWVKYVEPAQRGKMLCFSCYAAIKHLILERRSNVFLPGD